LKKKRGVFTQKKEFGCEYPMNFNPGKKIPGKKKLRPRKTGMIRGGNGGLQKRRASSLVPEKKGGVRGVLWPKEIKKKRDLYLNGGGARYVKGKKRGGVKRGSHCET